LGSSSIRGRRGAGLQSCCTAQIPHAGSQAQFLTDQTRWKKRQATARSESRGAIKRDVARGNHVAKVVATAIRAIGFDAKPHGGPLAATMGRCRERNLPQKLLRMDPQKEYRR
jgi:hypothetical protein